MITKETLQTPENPKLELIKELRSLKIDHRDGISEEIKHSTSKDSHWKVRNSWFHQVIGELEYVLRMSREEGIKISKEAFDTILHYCRNLNADGSFTDRLTTQEDIDKAEAMIDKVIVELEK